MPKKILYKKIPTTVYLTEKQLRFLEIVKEQLGIPFAEVVRRGINTELKKYIPEEDLADEPKRKVKAA